MDERYETVISFHHPTSFKHKRMDPHDRAAQFAPYAALVGYGDVVNETARTTEERSIPDECVIEALNRKLVYILSNAGRIEAAFTHFVKDERKSGGHYVTKNGFVEKFDEINRTLIFTDGTSLSIESITDIEYI